MAANKHIEQIGDTDANIRGNLDTLQIAIQTDDEETLIWADNGAAKYMYSAIQYSKNAAGVKSFINNEFNKITSNDNVVINTDNKKLLLGTGADGELYSSGNDVHLHNITQDADLIFGINDGGAPKTITWDADVDKLKHSAGTFDFDNDIITTSGTITAGTCTIATGSLTDTSGAFAFTTTGAVTHNQPLLGPNGAVGAPTYSFSTDTNTGMYYTATQLNFAVGGALRMAIGALNIGVSFPIHAANGAVNLPSYTFSADTNTGMYYTATQLNFAVGGVQVVNFTGVGGGIINVDGLVLTGGSITDGSGAIAFGNENLSSTGTLGIGTVTVQNGSSINLQEDINFTGATTENIVHFPDALANALSFQEGANIYMTFVSTNGSEAVNFGVDVGIGTAVPQHPLNVLSTSNTAGIQVYRDSVTSGEGASIGFRVSTTPGTVNNAEIQGIRTNDPNAGDTTLDFYVASRDFAMRIDGYLNVGINTLAPGAKLHVDQTSTTAAIPVLYLDQADISEEMIQFNTTIGVGNAIEAVGGKTLTVTHFIKVTLPGSLTRYMPCGTIA